jgi:hypothetical protein
MKTFVVSSKKALFGWPFYATWNLAAYAVEQRDWRASAKMLLLALPYMTLTIAAWAIFWVTVVWLLARLG